MRDRRIKAFAWDADPPGAGDHGFYACGYTEWAGRLIDREHQTRLLAKIKKSSKNGCGMVFEGYTFGNMVTVRDGGINKERELILAQPGTLTHYPSDAHSRWCIPAELGEITALYVVGFN